LASLTGMEFGLVYWQSFLRFLGDASLFFRARYQGIAAPTDENSTIIFNIPTENLQDDAVSHVESLSFPDKIDSYEQCD